MELERVVWISTQVVLAAIWLMVIAITWRVYLRLTVRAKSEMDSGLTMEEARIKRSFFAFAGVFMPTMAVLLPVLSLLPATDQLFIPAILAWLVMLVFGTLQFHLNLIPMKAALTIIAGLKDADSRRTAVPSQFAPLEHRRRNV